MVQNKFWTHLGLGPSLTEAQQPLGNPRVMVWPSDQQPWPQRAAHGGGSGSLGRWARHRVAARMAARVAS